VLCGFIIYFTLGHIESSNRYGGAILMRVTNTHAGYGALIYPSQGGRYRAEGCMALG